MIFFTADTHFGDERLKLFARDLVASSAKEVDDIIIKNWNSRVGENDTVYHLGDVGMNERDLDRMNKLSGKKILIRGNYDEPFTDDKLLGYFEEVHKELFLDITWESGEKETLYLNHYPVNRKEGYFYITAHIHGLWRVQPNTINVGTDAWHFYPISEKELKFYIKSVREVYDTNVFPDYTK